MTTHAQPEQGMHRTVRTFLQAQQVVHSGQAERLKNTNPLESQKHDQLALSIQSALEANKITSGAARVIQSHIVKLEGLDVRDDSAIKLFRAALNAPKR